MVNSDDLQKAYDVLGIDIKKGGEGSRGGKIIGHTSTGKPIYDSAEHPYHKKHFNAKDHEDAKGLHYRMAVNENEWGNVKESNEHVKNMDKHDLMARYGNDLKSAGKPYGETMAEKVGNKFRRAAERMGLVKTREQLLEEGYQAAKKKSEEYHRSRGLPYPGSNRAEDYFRSRGIPYSGSNVKKH